MHHDLCILLQTWVHLQRKQLVDKAEESLLLCELWLLKFKNLVTLFSECYCAIYANCGSYHLSQLLILLLQTDAFLYLRVEVQKYWLG